MLNQVLPSAVVCLAALNLVSAQTFTECNPLKEGKFAILSEAS
jgi:hypothetical protein